VQGWGRALFGEPTPLAAFAALQMPVLLMLGTNTQPSSRAVARQLAKAIPHMETIEFEGPGHMGPITHPELIDGVIEDFLRRHAAR
jgi:pimeloyl-ACP methyl ester carboxylesterase